MVKKWAGIEPEAVATVAEVHAVRACINGEATPDQQKLAMNWVMREAARVNDLSYRPGEKPFETAFNEGRRYPGILIRYTLEPEFLARAVEREKERQR